MKISSVIRELEKIQKKEGDIEVMFDDPQGNYGPWAVGSVNFRVAEEEEYPEEFDMPEGFKFVEIKNW